MNCPQCQSSTKVFGVELLHVYDGVLYWHCVACGYKWHRFPKNDIRRKRVPFALLSQLGPVVPVKAE